MTKHTSYDYLRVIIVSTLKTTSTMHCGDGSVMPAKEWSEKKEKTEGSINTICKDKQNKPYLPASTLRGSLRDRYKGEDKNLLFGSSHGDGSAGKIRLYDAQCQTLPDIAGDQYQHDTIKTTLRDGVAIDPITQTAKAHHLYVHEVVPANTSFTFQLEADRITQLQLDELLKLLAQWQGDMQTAIGKGRSKGWGKVRIDSTITLKTLTDDAIKHWVENKTPSVEWTTQKQTLPTTSTNAGQQITFHLYPSSPLLINDHARVKDAKEVPDLEFMRNEDNKAMIPGSSLKGAVRAQAHRIMASIAHLHYDIEATDAAKQVEASIQQLFGTEGKRSLLWFADAIDQSEQKTPIHKQFFNAVDRFTGGVAEGALFNVVAANCHKLSSQLNYDAHPKRQPQGSSWWKGLLLLVIRDFMEGDFAIGWGKGKGYGQATLVLEINEKEYQDFNELLSHLETNNQPDNWIEELHIHIQQLAEQGAST